MKASLYQLSYGGEPGIREFPAAGGLAKDSIKCLRDKPAQNRMAGRGGTASDEKSHAKTQRKQGPARPGDLCRATIADIDRTANAIVLREHKTSRMTGQLRPFSTPHSLHPFA
jgi:hypothetical protein